MSLATPTALIAEDEPLLAQALHDELASLWPQLRVLPPVGDGGQAVEQALAQRPDVCFLDIRMPGTDGLQAAETLAEEWPDDTPFPLLVFVTAYDQYAVAAFERAAVDYVLKPVQSERLAQTVARLRAALAQRTPVALDETLERLRGLLEPAAAPRLEVIQAGVGSALHFVPIDEVLYFEAADKYVRVITAEREHLIRTSLRELLPQLDPQRFWQVHRGTVVQARCIATAQRDTTGRLSLTMRGRPQKIVVSRLYAHRFKAM